MALKFKNIEEKYGKNLAEVVAYFQRVYETVINSITGIQSTVTGIQSTVNNLGTIATYNIWTGTQVEYDALEVYDDNTIYFIEEPVV